MAYLRPSRTSCGLLGSKPKALPRLVGKSKHTTPVTLCSVYRCHSREAGFSPYAARRRDSFCPLDKNLSTGNWYRNQHSPLIDKRLFAEIAQHLLSRHSEALRSGDSYPRYQPYGDAFPPLSQVLNSARTLFERPRRNSWLLPSGTSRPGNSVFRPINV
jgi:hypothetical protein